MHGRILSVRSGPARSNLRERLTIVVERSCDGEWANVRVNGPSHWHVTQAGGLTCLLSSTPPWLVNAIGSHWSLDWSAIDAALDDLSHCRDHSLMRGVAAIRQGKILEADDLTAPVTGWSAGELLAKPLMTAHEAAERLRTGVWTAVDVALEGAERPLIEVSGGLDSAVIACISAQRIDVENAVWVHYHGPEAEAEERSYARALADHLGATLIERERLAPEAGAAVVNHPLELRPSINRMDGAFDRREADFYQDAGVDRILTGKGGDALFMQGACVEALLDKVLHHGLDAVSRREIDQYSAWTGRSARAVRSRLLRAGKEETALWPGNPYRMVRTPVPRERPPGMGPGKWRQVQGIKSSLPLTDPCARSEAAAMSHPLLSPPALDAALAIPSYQMVTPGQDRALVRAAFGMLLPDEVLRRRSKAELGGYFGQLVSGSLPELREHLLDGRLAARGLMNLERLEADLNSEALIWGVDYLHILFTALIESWVRAWEPALQAARPFE